MSRYRLLPTTAQEAVLRDHCGHARYIWNLAVEQHSHWRPGRAGAPGYLEQCRQLTAARAEHPWLAAGSQTVQQQALRDFARAMTAFFDPANLAGRPSWRKAGRDEGFRIVGRGRQWDVRRVSRKAGLVWVPKACWVRFRWSRTVPPKAKSYRVTMDRAGRWHSFPGRDREGGIGEPSFPDRVAQKGLSQAPPARVIGSGCFSQQAGPSRPAFCFVSNPRFCQQYVLPPAGIQGLESAGGKDLNRHVAGPSPIPGRPGTLLISSIRQDHGRGAPDDSGGVCPGGERAEGVAPVSG